MHRILKAVIIMFSIGFLVVAFIKYAPKYFSIMRPAPAGIHGNYSLTDYNPTYKTVLHKDTLLNALAKEGLWIRTGRLHEYDPPWGSLRYRIGFIMCDSQEIESHIEFRKEKENDSTIFKTLWISALPNESNDSNVYKNLTMKYYKCFEDILYKHGVTK